MSAVHRRVQPGTLDGALHDLVDRLERDAAAGDLVAGLDPQEQRPGRFAPLPDPRAKHADRIGRGPLAGPYADETAAAVLIGFRVPQHHRKAFTLEADVGEIELRDLAAA